MMDFQIHNVAYILSYMTSNDIMPKIIYVFWYNVINCFVTAEAPSLGCFTTIYDFEKAFGNN